MLFFVEGVEEGLDFFGHVGDADLFVPRVNH